MADDIIPGVQSGQGPAARSVPTIGPDYRSLQNPERVDTQLPDSGAAARAAALGSTFKEFEGLSANIYTKAATTAGALAGAASGNTGSPDYKQGLAQLTAYGRAFNNAATGAYAVEASAYADDTAARLRVQANNDPGTYLATMTAARDAVIKTAPAMAVPMLTEEWNKRIAAGMGAVSGDQATEIRNTQRATYDKGVDRQTSRVALLEGSDNPTDQAAAGDEQAKLNLLIEGGFNAGLYSKAEAQSMHVAAMRSITAQVFSTQVDRELAKPDGGNIPALLENFRKAHIDNLSDPNSPAILSEPEYQQLMQNATTKVREQRILDSLTKGQGKTAEQQKWEAGDIQYTALAMQGLATPGMLAKAVVTGDLKPENARALIGLINNAGQQPKSNPAALLAARTDPYLADRTPAEIAGLPGISDQDKWGLVQEATRQKNGYEGTVQFKDSVASISAALTTKGKPAAMLSDSERTAVADTVVELKARLSKLPPSERVTSVKAISDQLVKEAQAREASNQVTGLTNAKASTMKLHGPGSAQEWSAEKLKKATDALDAQIQSASERAKVK